MTIRFQDHKVDGVENGYPSLVQFLRMPTLGHLCQLYLKRPSVADMCKHLQNELKSPS